MFLSSVRNLHLRRRQSESERKRRRDGGEGAADVGGSGSGRRPLPDPGRHRQRRGGLRNGFGQTGVPERRDHVSPFLSFVPRTPEAGNCLIILVLGVGRSGLNSGTRSEKRLCDLQRMNF